MEHTTTYVAFDNSKDTLAVAIAEGGLRGEVRFWGTIPNQAESVGLRRRHSDQPRGSRPIFRSHRSLISVPGDSSFVRGLNDRRFPGPAKNEAPVDNVNSNSKVDIVNK